MGGGGGGWVLYRKFTKSLIFCDVGDVLKNPFRYVRLFLLLTLLLKKNRLVCKMANLSRYRSETFGVNFWRWYWKSCKISWRWHVSRFYLKIVFIGFWFVSSRPDNFFMSLNWAWHLIKTLWSSIQRFSR